MKKRLLPKIDINELSRKELFNQLENELPKETQDYLERVEKRIKLYQKA